MSRSSSRLRRVPAALLMSGALFLAACESDEDRAERYFQSALELMEEGDTDRALLELRNVFSHDGFHFEARQLYADTLLARGDIQQAYSQYLRLIEQYPDTLEVRLTLAGIAIGRGDWAEAERHGRAARELEPDNSEVRAVNLALDYRQASLDRDEPERKRLAQAAAALLEETRAAGIEDNAGLVRIVIESLANSDDPASALPALNAALERDPRALDLNMGKARLLTLLGDREAVGAQYKRMTELFPENAEIRQGMISWFMSERDHDGAEAFLREVAGDLTGPTENHVTVLEFLQTIKGAEAARAEIERLIAANAGTENGRFYTSMLASLDFAAGRTEDAVGIVRTALAEAGDGEDANTLKTLLAEMLDKTGQREEARPLIADVLEADSSNVDALKMRASWLIEDDKAGEAIVDLRTALNQNPRDTQTLTLMAMAHERDGDIDLVGERLALAVEVSEQAPSESMRYARFLMAQGRDSVATTVLEDARQANPRNPVLLAMLAETHMRTASWREARQIVQVLRNLGTEETRRAASELELRILQSRNQTEESLKIIQEMSTLGDGENAAQATRVAILTIQTQLRAGKPEAARAYLDEAIENDPDNPDLQLLDAGLTALSGDLESAEASYRDLIEQFPQSDVPVRLLLSILMNTARNDEAGTLLDEALTRMPENGNLLWLNAGVLERQGDMEGAISVYERLYDQNTASTVIANNLASLLATHRDDAESLERAATISRRLRGTNIAPFQDTYGWIAYRRGNYEEAVEYLEPAARSLGTDPLVQYHLGMTYAALERPEDARDQLTRALELAGDSDLPQFATARETLAALDAASAATD